MKYQKYDLQDLDESTHELIVRNEIDTILTGKKCTICNEYFIGRQEKDKSVCSGTHPLTYAHEDCWEKDKESLTT